MKMMTPSATNAPKFNMNLNPAYQVEWATASSGKRLAATKRRVRFRFGFSNPEALAKGLNGNEARGEEHEVALIWSLMSGKRVVSLDGNEVHFSMGHRSDAKFETSWEINGGHTLKIVAHAAPPLRATPGFKQFDLFLDGISYFSLPRIYELGFHSGNSYGVPVARAMEPSAHDHGFAYNSYGQEQAPDNDFAYNNNRQEQERHRVHYQDEARCMNSYPSLEPISHGFSGPARRSTLEAIPSATGPVTMVAPPQDVLSEPTCVSQADLFEAQPSPMTVAVDEFTPVQVQVHPPTFQDVSNQILSAYGPAPTVPALAALTNHPHTQCVPQMQAPVEQEPPYLAPNAHHIHHQQTFLPPVPQPCMVYPGASAAAASSGFYPLQEPATPHASTSPAVASAVVTPTMTMMRSLEVDELRDSPEPVDEMDQALYNLVNLNDLKETRATPEQIKTKKQKEMNKALAHKSRPKAPATTDWHVGTNASLADIQKHKKPVAPPAKEVMKVHAFDPAAAQAGMMVVYGQQPQMGGHPGSIPVVTGFGAGRVYGGRHGYNQSLSLAS